MTTVKPPMEAGVPGFEKYIGLLETSLFRDMEAFSHAFLGNNGFLRSHYKWVKDPLHQWSRQWEYPYVLLSITEYAALRRSTGTSIKVLDAGSGITFFPYYLMRSVPDLDITCCDSDGSLAALFDRVNRSMDSARRVNFIEADMHVLPFDDQSIDMIYCISVLEHTRNYTHILDEFHRVLRPSGCLVLSFDVGLDGVSEIAPPAAMRLLGEVTQRFLGMHGCPEIKTEKEDMLTSKQAIQGDNRLSPWKFPRLALIKAALRARRIPTSMNKNLTVYCGTFVKSSAERK